MRCWASLFFWAAWLLQVLQTFLTRPTPQKLASALFHLSGPCSQKMQNIDVRWQPIDRLSLTAASHFKTPYARDIELLYFKVLMLISACCLRQFNFLAVETTELFASLAGDPIFLQRRKHRGACIEQWVDSWIEETDPMKYTTPVSWYYLLLFKYHSNLKPAVIPHCWQNARSQVSTLSALQHISFTNWYSKFASSYLQFFYEHT